MKLAKVLLLAGAAFAVGRADLQAQRSHDAALIFAIQPGASSELDPEIAAAVAAASAGLLQQLTAGTLTTPAGAPIPAAAQQLVLAVIQGTAPPADLAAILAASGDPVAAAELAEAMVGLLTNPTTGQIATAISEFNTLVSTASGAFLASPPAAFNAVYAVITALATAAGD